PPLPLLDVKAYSLPPRLRKKCGKLGQRSPQGNIKTRCYATPHKPENAANCRRDTYGMPFVSLILSIHTAAASCREHERKYGLTSFISVTETVVSVEHQIAANQRVPDA